MNRTTRAAKQLLGLATFGWLSFSALALTCIQFTGLETNVQLMRAITLVVVPPSGEQQINTNLVIQPNILIKPTTNGYPLACVQAADYDVYVAGIRQTFRIAVPNTNVIIPWNVLVKDGLTTYNYTNPLPVLGGAVIYNLYATNIITTNLYVTFLTNNYAYITNLYATYVTNIYESVSNFYAINVTLPQVQSNSIVATDAAHNLTNAILGIGLTFSNNVLNGAYVLNFGGSGTNLTNWGWFTVLGTNQYAEIDLYDWTGTNIVSGFSTNHGGWWGFGNLNGFTNFQPSIITVTTDSLDPNARRIVAGANLTFTDGGAGSTFTISTTATNYNSVTTNNTFVVTNIFLITSNATFIVKRGGTVIFESPATLIDSNAAPNTIASWDALETLTNASVAARLSFSGNVLDLSTVGTAGTYTKATFNAWGQETSGSSATLASADFANQGTTTTVLHGNAAGNPSFGPVALSTDVSGTLAAAQFPALTGDVTTPGASLATMLATVNSSPGTFGDGTHVAVVTVNGKGLATAVSSATITGAAPTGSAGGELAGNYPNPTFAKTVVTNGESVAITVSNQFRVDATHAFVSSNATASSLASFDAVDDLTNAMLSARFTFSGNLLDIASGSIPNADLANSSITIQGSAVALGGSTLAAGSSPYFNAANETNVQGSTVVGGTKTIVFDASYLWPGDTLAATWTTNTPSVGSASIQSAGPSIKAWSISQTVSNRWLLQMNMPADWDGAAVNYWVSVASGTNSAVANAKTNVWAVSAAIDGTALGTVVAVTNNLPTGTGLIKQNFDLASVTVAGSPSPGDPIVVQLESRAGNTPWSSTNLELLVAVGMRYNVTNIQNNAIQWP